MPMTGEIIQDGEDEGGNEDSDEVVVEQKGLKRLFKQIVKNANSGDKVDVNKEYAPLMKKYMERTQQA